MVLVVPKSVSISDFIVLNVSGNFLQPAHVHAPTASTSLIPTHGVWNQFIHILQRIDGVIFGTVQESIH